MPAGVGTYRGTSSGIGFGDGRARKYRKREGAQARAIDERKRGDIRSTERKIERAKRNPFNFFQMYDLDIASSKLKNRERDR